MQEYQEEELALDPWITTALREQGDEESSDDEVPLDSWIQNLGTSLPSATEWVLSPSSSGFGYSL